MQYCSLIAFEEAVLGRIAYWKIFSFSAKIKGI